MKRTYRIFVAMFVAILALAAIIASAPSAAARPPDARVRHLAPPPKPHVVQPHHPKPKRPGKVAPDWPNLPARPGSSSTNAGGSTSSGSLPSGITSQLYWHGGPVQTHPEAYAIFWGPYWKTVSGSNADWQIVENYFQDVTGTPFASILTQYYDGTGSIANAPRFGGAWFDTSPPPTDLSCLGTTIEDSAIQTEVANAITTNNWPADANATYFVYTPPDNLVNASDLGGLLVTGCSGFGLTGGSQYCGYHYYLNSIGVAYAVLPYPSQNAGCVLSQSPNSNVYGDSLVNATSHEQFEAITDPQVQVTNGSIVKNGWYDDSGAEIGDKCALSFPSAYTKLANGGQFNIQDEFANTLDQCVNEFAAPAVYVGSSNGVYAFDQVSGTFLWRYLAPSSCNVTSPVLMRGTVYFGACNTVYALDAATTTLLWSYTLSATLAGAPVVSNGTVYSSGRDGYVYALNATTGALNWHTQILNGDIGVPVVGGGAVYVAASPPYTGLLTALNATTGTQLWLDTFTNDSVGSLAYANGTVFFSTNYWFCTTGSCVGLNAYDAASGVKIWGGVLVAQQGPPPAVANSVLYVPEYGTLYAYDPIVGGLLWKTTISTTTYIGSTPMIVSGIAYMSMHDGTMVALNTSDHSVPWQVTADTSQPSQPVYGDGMLFAAGGDTSVFALDPGTGSQVWRTGLAYVTQNTPALG